MSIETGSAHQMEERAVLQCPFLLLTAQLQEHWVMEQHYCVAKDDSVTEQIQCIKE